MDGYENKALLWFMLRMNSLLLALFVFGVEAHYLFVDDTFTPAGVAPVSSPGKLGIQMAMWSALIYFVHMAVYTVVPCRVQEHYHVGPQKFLFAGLCLSTLALGSTFLEMFMELPASYPSGTTADNLETEFCAEAKSRGAKWTWGCWMLRGARVCTIILFVLVLIQFIITWCILPQGCWEIPRAPIRDHIRMLFHWVLCFPLSQRRGANEDIPLETLEDAGDRPERRLNDPALENMLFGPFSHAERQRSPQPENRTQGCSFSQTFVSVANPTRGQVLPTVDEEPSTPPPNRHRRHNDRASRSSSLAPRPEGE
ncbi:hypothetical protein IWZ00DRAFT_492704 [Phyllosticta capitalensis]|uniref:uncharacterized protein n=1 Tax=Phyllosticta capitalensis TaxID=121624 RepID=UPI00312DF55D